MRVSMRRRGGFLDVDQTVEVDKAEVRIVDTGTRRGGRRLGGEQERQVGALARAVLDLPDGAVTDPGEPVSDDMLTEIEIDDGGRVRLFTLHSGGEAPSEVWALVKALGELSGT